jgi:hypothetical protein
VNAKPRLSVSPEPPVGTVQRGGDGSVWRKVRMLGPIEREVTP